MIMQQLKRLWLISSAILPCKGECNMANARAAATRVQGYAQVSKIINLASKIVIGEKAPEVQDSATLVSLGEKILPYDSLSINFIAALFARIGKTIIETRAYRSKLSFLMYDDFEWGGIVQKIDTDVPDAVDDASLELTEGQSIDMYIVAKPSATMKFFYNKSTYTFFMTIQRKWLKDAFTSLAAMGAFLKALETKMRNKLERANENMGRLTLGNLACLAYDTPREIKLITEFNTLGGTTSPITSWKDALYGQNSAAFLRFMSGRMQDVATEFGDNTVLWNAEKKEKFTNPEERVFVVPTEVTTAMKTNVLWNAFHRDVLELGNNAELSFFTSPEPDKRMSLKQRVNTAAYGETPNYKDIEIEALAGVMFDKRAAGTYRTNTEVATTPYNARGRYTNTFWHEDNMWFNDTGEQHAIFTLR